MTDMRYVLSCRDVDGSQTEAVVRCLVRVNSFLSFREGVRDFVLGHGESNENIAFLTNRANMASATSISSGCVSYTGYPFDCTINFGKLLVPVALMCDVVVGVVVEVETRRRPNSASPVTRHALVSLDAASDALADGERAIGRFAFCPGTGECVTYTRLVPGQADEIAGTLSGLAVLCGGMKNVASHYLKRAKARLHWWSVWNDGDGGASGGPPGATQCNLQGVFDDALFCSYQLRESICLARLMQGIRRESCADCAVSQVRLAVRSRPTTIPCGPETSCNCKDNLEVGGSVGDLGGTRKLKALQGLWSGVCSFIGFLPGISGPAIFCMRLSDTLRWCEDPSLVERLQTIGISCLISGRCLPRSSSLDVCFDFDLRALSLADEHESNRVQGYQNRSSQSDAGEVSLMGVSNERSSRWMPAETHLACTGGTPSQSAPFLGDQAAVISGIFPCPSGVVSAGEASTQLEQPPKSAMNPSLTQQFVHPPRDAQEVGNIRESFARNPYASVDAVNSCQADAVALASFSETNTGTVESFERRNFTRETRNSAPQAEYKSQQSGATAGPTDFLQTEGIEAPNPGTIPIASGVAPNTPNVPVRAKQVQNAIEYTREQRRRRNRMSAARSYLARKQRTATLKNALDVAKEQASALRARAKALATENEELKKKLGCSVPFDLEADEYRK